MPTERGAMAALALTILPLCAAIMSINLAFVAATGQTRTTATTRLFFLLNVSIALWSFVYFLQLNSPGMPEPSLAPFGSPDGILFTVMMFGVAGAPTYWFLFAAAYARKPFWSTPLGIALAHIPLVYTLAVAITNPLHHLFVTETRTQIGFAYGPLAIPHQLLTLVLVLAGTYLLVTHLWRQPHGWGRRQAAVAGAAAFIHLCGGAIWATRAQTGIPINVNPSPIMFALWSGVLGVLVLKGGLGDIVPVAANQAFITMADGIIVIDARGRIAAVNPAAQRLLPAASAGGSLDALLPEAERREERGSADADYHEFETSLQGGVYWVRVRRTRGQRNAPIGQVVFLTDVTEVREAQQELGRLNERLSVHVVALEDAHRETEQRRFALEHANWELRMATQAKSRFLANMSHEFRTPLNSMIGFTGVLLQGLAGELNDEQRKQLKMANDSGKHLLRLINDVLDLARIEAGTQRLRASWVAVDDVIESVAATVSPLVDEKGLELDVEVMRPGQQVETDPLRVRQILLNLLGNAIKFTDRGRIWLRADANDTHVAFSVRDEGEGIPPTELGRIFNAFEQVIPESGGKPQGTGLGLSISKELASILGGTLTVASELGEGSTFTLTLPVHAEAEWAAESDDEESAFRG